MQWFCMEGLAILLCHTFHIWSLLLENKPNLCSNAEICRTYKNHFLEHCIFCELMSIFDLSVQLLVPHHVQMHNIANVQVENPIELVLDSKRASHIKLIDLLTLKSLKLLQRWETDSEPSPFISVICLTVFLDKFLVSNQSWDVAFVLEFFYYRC